LCLAQFVIDRRYSARAKDRGAPAVATDATNLENVMKNVLFAAATAMMIGAVSPAVATPPEEDTYQGYAACPPAGECHALKERVVLPNGHVVFLTRQVRH
jgi:hypothetical protein